MTAVTDQDHTDEMDHAKRNGDAVAPRTTTATTPPRRGRSGRDSR
ncbi:hypothetical protein N7U49_17225 [Streptomyces sp. AD2-2]|nr:hypothetical protein N7U49_17225 [Streptomyces sp. AD2-2]